MFGMRNYRLIDMVKKNHVFYTLITCLSLFLLSFVFTGCNTKKTPKELFDEYRSGVVLILNQYYFRMKLPNDQYMYFSDFDSNGDLTFYTTPQEIKNKKALMFGSGFFIDSKGTIMTNRHIVSPEIDKIRVKNQLNNLLESLKNYYNLQLEQLQQQYADFENQRSEYAYNDDEGNTYYDPNVISQIDNQESGLEYKFDSLKNDRDRIMDGNLSLEQLDIEPVCEIGIAYDGTFVTKINDFFEGNGCVVIKVSNKQDVDLALIQLRNQTTPGNIKAFDVYQRNEGQNLLQDAQKLLFGNPKKKTLEIDQELYMIGYNDGPVLANTKQGIRVQMTSGKITQLPDGERLTYSIPAIAGSSGSPVIDKDGHLVAVNFAGLTTGDNFNFGIPLNKIRAFLRNYQIAFSR